MIKRDTVQRDPAMIRGLLSLQVSGAWNPIRRTRLVLSDDSKITALDIFFRATDPLGCNCLDPSLRLEWVIATDDTSG